MGLRTWPNPLNLVSGGSEGETIGITLRFRYDRREAQGYFWKYGLMDQPGIAGYEIVLMTGKTLSISGRRNPVGARMTAFQGNDSRTKAVPK